MLGVLITIHELGHFIAAKIFRVYVFEFAIGFGPKIFRKKKGETYYSLRALPLGGYVAMLGEEDAVHGREREPGDGRQDLYRTYRRRREYAGAAARPSQGHGKSSQLDAFAARRD